MPSARLIARHISYCKDSKLSGHAVCVNTYCAQFTVYICEVVTHSVRSSQEFPHKMEICCRHSWYGKMKLFIWSVESFYFHTDHLLVRLRNRRPTVCEVTDLESMTWKLFVALVYCVKRRSIIALYINYRCLIVLTLYLVFWCWFSSALFFFNILTLNFRSLDACFTATSSWSASVCLSSDLRPTSLSLKKQWFWLCSTPYYQVAYVPFSTHTELVFGNTFSGNIRRKSCVKQYRFKLICDSIYTIESAYVLYYLLSVWVNTT